MAGDIPPGNYTLELGSSFIDSKRNGQKYHALRYDFKPKSASNNADTFIATGGNNDIHVAVPGTDGDNMTVYKGSQKEAKPKECLLFFNKETGTVRLEKISSNINVKQTRDVDKPTENVLRSEISKLRAASSSKLGTYSKEENGSSSSSSNSSDSSDSEEEQQANSTARQRISSSSSMSDMETQVLASVNGSSNFPLDDMPLFEPTASRPIQNLRSQVESSNHDSLGLNLSESSDDDD